MKSLNQAEAQRQFDDVVAEAQRQPIAILKQGREIAVVLSMAEYERLRDGAIRGFLELRESIAREAASAGMTAERLSDLLDSD